MLPLAKGIRVMKANFRKAMLATTLFLGLGYSSISSAVIGQLSSAIDTGTSVYLAAWTYNTSPTDTAIAQTLGVHAAFSGPFYSQNTGWFDFPLPANEIWAAGWEANASRARGLHYVSGLHRTRHPTLGNVYGPSTFADVTIP
jgi:hypothetical protein